MTPAIENTIGNTIGKQAARTSFLGALFGIDKFITPWLVRAVFIIGAAVILLITLGYGLIETYSNVYSWYKYGAYGYADSFLIIFLRLVACIVAAALGVLTLRLYCEFLMIIFKINENLQFLRDRNERS